LCGTCSARCIDRVLEYASKEYAERFGGGGRRVVDGGAGIRGRVKFDCSASASSSGEDLDGIGVTYMD
jgi:hypothetical protein